MEGITNPKKVDSMRLNHVANKILLSTTPKFPYDVRLIQERNDGAYIFRMAPETKINSDAGVWFPDVSVEDSYLNNRASIKLRPAIEIIEQILKDHEVLGEEKVLNPIYDAVFSLLHEEGHWVYYLENYINNGLDGDNYLRDYYLYNDELGLNKLLEAARKNNELYIYYHREYRKHPFEAYADNYAIIKMKEQNILDLFLL
jgi:hypothetical protein